MEIKLANATAYGPLRLDSQYIFDFTFSFRILLAWLQSGLYDMGQLLFIDDWREPNLS